MNLAEATTTYYTTHGYRIEAIENGHGHIIGRLYKSTPKAKYNKEKCVFAYRFGSYERREEYFANYAQNLQRHEENKRQYKAEKKAREAQELDSIKVGDIFCYSWGYDQTNVDFFQIIERKGATRAIIRPITCKSLGEDGFMCDHVIPVKDSFKGEAETVVLQGSYFKRSCGYAKKTNPTQKHYRSWYA